MEDEIKAIQSLIKPRSIEDLELSHRVVKCLRTANIDYIYELVQKTTKEMLNIKNFGRQSLKEISTILEEMGLCLSMDLKRLPYFDLLAITVTGEGDLHLLAPKLQYHVNRLNMLIDVLHRSEVREFLKNFIKMNY